MFCAAEQTVLTLVEERLGGPEPGQGRHKGVYASAEKEKGLESPEILMGSCAPTKRLMGCFKCLSPGARWERGWNRTWWGHTDGWMEG